MPGISLQAYHFLSKLHSLRESTIIFWEIHAHDADEDVMLDGLNDLPLTEIQRGLAEWISYTEANEHLTRLDLATMAMDILPKEVELLTHLQTLDLRWTGIYERPPHASHIQNVIITPIVVETITPEEIVTDEEPSFEEPKLKRQKTWSPDVN